MRANPSRVDAHANPSAQTIADVVVLRESRRVGQHEWRRAIRGRMQSPTVFAVAQAVVSYTSKDGSKAHPGNERLAADLGCTTKTIQRSLKWLRDEGWLRLDQAANMPNSGRRIAQEWSLTIPEQWTRATSTVDTDVPDSGQDGPPTTPTSDPDLHHSASVKRAHSASGPRRNNRLNPDREDYDSDYAEEWIADAVDGFSGYETTVVYSLMAEGVHPYVIARTILAERNR